MTSEELRNYATVLAALIALAVFLYNTRLNRRKERIESLSRFFEVHDRLVDDAGFLMVAMPTIREGTFRRDHADAVAERRFKQLLLHVEQLAFLANNDAVPVSTQVYMFGEHARALLPLITDEERSSVFWEMAVRYLERIALLADDYERMRPEQRKRFQR